MLYHAGFTFSKELVELYLEHGLNINEGCYDGDTVLHTAVNKGKDDFAKWLVSKGANPLKVWHIFNIN